MHPSRIKWGWKKMALGINGDGPFPENPSPFILTHPQGMHSHPFYKPAGIFFKNEILYRTLSNKTSKKLILEIGSQKWRHSWRKVIHRVIYNIVLKKFRRFWHLSAMFPLKVHSWKSWNWVSYSVGSRLLTSILTLYPLFTLLLISRLW